MCRIVKLQDLDANVFRGCSLLKSTPWKCSEMRKSMTANSRNSDGPSYRPTAFWEIAQPPKRHSWIDRFATQYGNYLRCILLLQRATAFLKCKKVLLMASKALDSTSAYGTSIYRALKTERRWSLTVTCSHLLAGHACHTCHTCHTSIRLHLSFQEHVPWLWNRGQASVNASMCGNMDICAHYFLDICVYVYIYVCVCTCMCTNTSMYRTRRWRKFQR